MNLSFNRPSVYVCISLFGQSFKVCRSPRGEKHNSVHELSDLDKMSLRGHISGEVGVERESVCYCGAHLLSSRNPDARILLLILKPYIAFLNTFFLLGNKKEGPYSVVATVKEKQKSEQT